MSAPTATANDPQSGMDEILALLDSLLDQQAFANFAPPGN
jgi:hypothetical protein